MDTTMFDAPNQPMLALEQANQIRLARSQLKRRVAQGEIGAAEVIGGCPKEAETMAVSELLLSQHRWGQRRCQDLLAALHISEAKRIGSMTPRQRQALVDTLSRPRDRERPRSPWPAWV